MTPITNKIYTRNCWYYMVVYKKIQFQIDDFRFLVHRKYVIPCSYNAPFVLRNLLYTQ
jgi:hypothetical protein